MKAYCFECKKWVEYHLEKREEEDTIKGVSFHCIQEHAYCCECHEELFPEEVSDKNVNVAHDAYREALGAITVAEMKSILEKYNIGARPLSLLLGWGENTVERQMKHTLPDESHTKALKELLDPLKMLILLTENGGRLSKVALEKSLAAVLENFCSVTGSDSEENALSPEVCYQKSNIECRSDQVSSLDPFDNIIAA